MKDFRLYNISDFVMDEDFIRWVQQKKAEDAVFWNNWLSQNPDKHLVVAEARKVLESINIEQKTFTETEIQAETARLLQTIREHLLPAQQPGRIIAWNRKWWYVAAAVLLPVVAGMLYFLPSSKKHSGKPSEIFAYEQQVSSRQMTEQVNTSGKPIILHLPDGSIIELGVNSRVSYSAQFDSSHTRDVYLSGEADFSVTRNPERPFRVFANEIVTRVLGTRFVVRSFDNDSTIQVTVKSGKVSVYSQSTGSEKIKSEPDKPGGYIITPNQQLVYERIAGKFQKILLDDPLMVGPGETDSKMLYEDTPLRKVFDQLSKAYGINIVYDSDLLKKCTVTADLRDESFYQKLDLICSAVGAWYEVIDGQVVVQSGGCN